MLRAIRKNERKWERFPAPRANTANGRPAAAPLRKNRFVGRMERERRELKRQTLPQAEPTEVERTRVIETILRKREFEEERGAERKDL